MTIMAISQYARHDNRFPISILMAGQNGQIADMLRFRGLVFQVAQFFIKRIDIIIPARNDVPCMNNKADGSKKADDRYGKQCCSLFFSDPYFRMGRMPPYSSHIMGKEFLPFHAMSLRSFLPYQWMVCVSPGRVPGSYGD